VSAAWESTCKVGRNFDMRNAAVFRLRLVLLLTFCAHPLFGGVVLDGSFGTHGALPGPNFMISANYGRQIGGNLFQSFSQFNLNSSQSATFTGPQTVHNIMARVTSGSPSSVDGTIHSDIQGANLFFMNPAGVLFGQHAQLDVSGSFAVTTANYLKLVGDGRFDANLGGGDVLTSAPVNAFGFLNQTPAQVSFTGSNSGRYYNGNIIPGPSVNIAPQKSFSVVAGDIGMNRSTISGEGSRVNLVSVKSPGEVQLDATDLTSPVDVTQFTEMGTINLRNLALIDTSGPGGGPVVIRGGNFYLDNSQILSQTTGSIQGGAVDIAVTDSMKITSLGQISSSTVGIGNAGSVNVTANSLLIDGTGSKFSTTGILADTTVGSSGNGGSIAVHAGDFKIMPNGLISSQTEGAGNAGSINVTADSLLIDGESSQLFTGITASSNGPSGNAGNLMVQAGDLTIIGGGEISSSTFGNGNAGEVTVTADSLVIDGAGSGIFAVAGFAGLPNSGIGGDVVVKAGDLSLQNAGAISAASFTSAKAGSLEFSLGTLSMDSSSSISTANSSTNDRGGLAGSVSIKATGSVTLKIASSISTASTSGDAGDIKLESDGTIKLKDQSSITASAGVNGGDIAITAPGQLVYLIDSSITATAGSTGSSGIGGNITIDHPQFIVASNSLISANATVGTAGNVYLNSDFLFTSNSTIFATGTVNITAPTLDLGAELITLPASLLSAESQLQERCTALLRGDFSSFISIGRGGTEPAPEELQSTF
jgi:filamentous hemagglutinin family protein